MAYNTKREIILDLFKRYDDSIMNNGYYCATNTSVVYIPDNKDYVKVYTIHLEKRKILELQKDRIDFEILDEFEVEGFEAIAYKMKKLKKLSEMHENYVRSYFLDFVYKLGAKDDYRKLEYIRPFTNSEFNRIIDLIMEVKPPYLDIHKNQFMLDDNNDLVLIDCEYSEAIARKIDKVVQWHKKQTHTTAKTKNKKYYEVKIAYPKIEINNMISYLSEVFDVSYKKIYSSGVDFKIINKDGEFYVKIISSFCHYEDESIDDEKFKEFSAGLIENYEQEINKKIKDIYKLGYKIVDIYIDSDRASHKDGILIAILETDDDKKEIYTLFHPGEVKEIVNKKPHHKE